MCDEKVLREAFAAFDVDKNGTIGNHRATFTNIYNSIGLVVIICNVFTYLYK